MYTFFKVTFSSTQIMKNHKWNWRNSLHNIFSVLMTDEFTFILLVQTVNYHSGLAKQRMSLTNSVRVTSLALLSLTFNIPWKFRVEIRNEALCALRKLAESAFWWICLGKIFKEHLINKKVRKKISKEEIISLTIIFWKKKKKIWKTGKNTVTTFKERKRITVNLAFYTQWHYLSKIKVKCIDFKFLLIEKIPHLLT